MGQYFPPDQWAHGNMVVNTFTLNNGNEEILAEGGKLKSLLPCMSNRRALFIITVAAHNGVYKKHEGPYCLMYIHSYPLYLVTRYVTIYCLYLSKN